jgi:hypothetical protein
MSDSNKNVVIGPRWGPDAEMDWRTDHWSQNNLNLNLCTLFGEFEMLNKFRLDGKPEFQIIIIIQKIILML